MDLSKVMAAAAANPTAIAAAQQLSAIMTLLKSGTVLYATAFDAASLCADLALWRTKYPQRVLLGAPVYCDLDRLWYVWYLEPA